MVFCLLFTFLTQSSLFWQHDLLGKITFAQRGWDQPSRVSPCTSWFRDIFFQPGQVMRAVRKKSCCSEAAQTCETFLPLLHDVQWKATEKPREKPRGRAGRVLRALWCSKKGVQGLCLGCETKQWQKLKQGLLVWKPNVSALLFRAESSWGRCDVSFLEPGQERKILNS